MSDKNGQQRSYNTGTYRGSVGGGKLWVIGYKLWSGVVNAKSSDNP
jgi:hypothetical protein